VQSRGQPHRSHSAEIARGFTRPPDGNNGYHQVERGDAVAAIKGAAKVLAADYVPDHVSHVCLEPMNAAVAVTRDQVEIWASNQLPTTMQFIGAAVGAQRRKR
jgi:xanthine dehydrogenase molybdopterin-binding subunit B